MHGPTDKKFACFIHPKSLAISDTLEAPSSPHKNAAYNEDGPPKRRGEGGGIHLYVYSIYMRITKKKKKKREKKKRKKKNK